MIKIFRVDSRLVHGQTVNYWCDKYNISKIVVINDELAKDDFRKLFYKISISNEFVLEFITIEESISYEYEENNKYLVIFKSIEDVVEYLKANGPMKELIISNTDNSEAKFEVAEGICISDMDREYINKIEELYNVKVLYQAMPE